MRRKLIAIPSILIILVLTATTAFATNIRLGSVSFSLGSLIAEGRLFGLGKTDVTVILDAQGIPTVTCTNRGGQRAPGQNPPKVSARGSTLIGSQFISKNGSAPFEVETQDPVTSGKTAKQLGCPNNSWAADIVFVSWTNASITVTSGGTVLLKQNYTCTTTSTSVSCQPVS